MKKRTLKLGLSRETLRAIDPSEAVEIAGASHPASRCVTCGSRCPIYYTQQYTCNCI